MSNFLQDALRAIDDEELERFIHWLNMERSFELSTCGSKLKDLMSEEVQQTEPTCLPVLQQALHFSELLCKPF